MKSLTYVAFLRGINVGGNSIISMEDLKKAFASLGFARVRTLLASGNVLFETTETDRAVLKSKIEQKLHTRFKSKISVLLRTLDEIQALLANKPFKNVKITSQTRLNVSFLPMELEHGFKTSKKLAVTEFEIFRVSPGEVCSVVEIAPKHGTSELMRVLEKQFGKNITTRTWNTVERIARPEKTENGKSRKESS